MFLSIFIGGVLTTTIRATSLFLIYPKIEALISISRRSLYVFLLAMICALSALTPRRNRASESKLKLAFYLLLYTFCYLTQIGWHKNESWSM